MKTKTKAKRKQAYQPKANKPTLVCFLLDRSGSMASCRDETITGFNAYIDKIRKDLPASSRFSMMQFDSHSFDMLYQDAKLTEVKDLTTETFVPRGNTPLYDAMGKMIHANRKMAERFKVLFVSLTDGLENASSEWKLDTIKSLIKEMEDIHHWTFAHIGVGMQGWATGQTMYQGTQSFSNVMQSDPKDTVKMYAHFACRTSSYAHGATGQSVDTSFWDDKTKAAKK